MSIKSCFINNPDVLEAMELLNEFHVMLNCHPLRPTIKIKVYEFIPAARVPYRIVFSHLIHTPVQNEPTVPSMSAAIVESEIGNYLALIKGFMSESIAGGAEPSKSWLIPNPNY